MKDRLPDSHRVALSIVIPTYNRHSILREAITSVERQTLDADAFELIVVDNSSDRQAQVDFLSALVVDCHCDYVLEDRPGANRARNLGTHLARGDVVAFLDDDALPDQGWAEAIVDRFAERPLVGVMGGPVMPIWPGERPAWLPLWADTFLSSLDHGPSPRTIGPSEHLISANLAFRKGILDLVGGFPEHLGRRGGMSLLSNDELSVRRAVVARGSDAFYDPRMRVRHRVHADRLSQDWLRRRLAWQVVSDLLEPGDNVTGGGPCDPARLLALLDEAPARATETLLGQHDDPSAVTRQMQAVQALLRLLLTSPG